MISTIILWVLAAGLGALVWMKRDRATAVAALRKGVRSLLNILPRVAVAVLTAGFVARLIPTEAVASHIGPDSGMRGIVLAMLVGGFIPAGPIISFPLVAVLSQAGAGTVQLVSLLTAWAVFALHRVVIYEIPMMGARFSAVRLFASLPLPIISALLATGLISLFGF